MTECFPSLPTQLKWIEKLAHSIQCERVGLCDMEKVFFSNQIKSILCISPASPVQWHRYTTICRQCHFKTKLLVRNSLYVLWLCPTSDLNHLYYLECCWAVFQDKICLKFQSVLYVQELNPSTWICQTTCVFCDYHARWLCKISRLEVCFGTEVWWVFFWKGL